MLSYKLSWSSTYQKARHRRFRCTKIAPFAANISFLLYKKNNPGSEEDTPGPDLVLQVAVNEHLVNIPSQHHTVDVHVALEYFEKKIKVFKFQLKSGLKGVLLELESTRMRCYETQQWALTISKTIYQANNSVFSNSSYLPNCSKKYALHCFYLFFQHFLNSLLTLQFYSISSFPKLKVHTPYDFRTSTYCIYSI